MYRKLVVFIIFLFIISTCQAQNYIGLRGGISSSDTPLRLDLDDAYTVDQNSLQYFSFAISFEKELKKSFSLNIEVEFYKEGSLLLKQYQSSGEYFYNSNEVQYIRFPIQIKYGLDLSDIQIFAGIGPSVSYAFNGKSFFSGENTGTKQIEFSSSAVQRFDFGAFLSAGVERMIAQKVKVYLGANYYLGLFDINPASEEEVYNVSAAVFIGASLPLSKIEQ